MKRIIVLSAVLLLAIAGSAWAGVYKGLYKLVWSQDKEVCSAILSLFNADMKQYGEIRYEQHKIFVEWKPMALPDDAGNADACGVLSTTTLDIDNDGRNDRLIRTSFCFHSILTDSLFIFPADSDIPAKLTWKDLGDVLITVPNKVDIDSYELKYWPKSERGKWPVMVGRPLVLEPFVWQGITYLSMTDRYYGYRIVIAKHKGGETLEDVCYLDSTSSKKS